MDLKIRKATLDDVDNGLLKIFIEGYKFHQNERSDVLSNISDDNLKEGLINYFETLSIIVITDNEKIVGYLAYTISKRHNGKLDIEQLIISKEYRRQGLGKKLIEEAKKIAKENECSRIELECWTFNENAINMYEHIGFNRQKIVYEMKL